MQLMDMGRARAARELFEREWASRHPSTPPPALYPENPEDPIWREADELMDACWAQVPYGAADDSAELETGLGALQPEERWFAGPGYIVCPDGHSSAPSKRACGDCGRPIPGHLEWEANNNAAILGAKVGMQWLRDSRFQNF